MTRLMIGVTTFFLVLSTDTDAQTILDLSEGWRFQPDPENVGVAQRWFAQELNETDWTAVTAGVRWEDQGFPGVDGFAWYRCSVDIPAEWEGKPVWLSLGSMNDSGSVYCNDRLINTFGEAEDVCMAWVPLVAELTPGLRFGESNLISIRSHDWGGSGGLWRLPCVLTTDLTQLPLDSLVSVYMEPEGRLLSVDVHSAGLGNLRPDVTLSVSLAKPGSAAPQRWETSLPAQTEIASIRREVDDAEPGATYTLHVALTASDGRPFAGMDWTQKITWPTQRTWDGEYAKLNVRNNFVTDLLAVRLPKTGDAEHLFVNPRDGWVFVQSSAAKKAPSVYLDEETDPLVWRTNPETGCLEAMRKLTEGEHAVRVKNTESGSLDIRTVPEIAYCYYPSSLHIKPQGPYDWPYVTRYVLPHVNTLITRSGGGIEREFSEWLREGRQWIANSSLPGLSAETPPTVDEVFQTWAGVPGTTDAGYGGIIVDEFLAKGPEFYRAWGDALRKLHDVPSFADRTFYAWCGGDVFSLGGSADFFRLVMDLGDRFSWEKYLQEMPTEAEALNTLIRELRVPMLEWRKQMPGVEKQLVMCLGYLSAPPESLNREPSVDYRVYMDMQFHMLATDPSFWGLYGVMEYMASYADEEAVRWAHRLFRHYCIEGNRSRYCNDPYRLSHIENPDFADGLTGWRVDPAEANGIAAKSMEGFSWLQGRYPKTSTGDSFLWMKRAASRPNAARQTVKGLVPGRVYSLKFISADLGELDRKQKLSLSVTLDNVEWLEQHAFQVEYPSCYSHEQGPYTRENPAWMNYHRLVFRAKEKTSELKISDWVTPDRPGGPIGQETVCNFVEIQPFLEP